MEETKAKGWWHAFSDTIPKDFSFFVSLENAANSMSSYQTTFLPGLVHTVEYRRALMWTEFPNKPTDEAERMLAVGLNRQSRLTDSQNPLHLDVLVDESVLRRVTGSTAVMADQMRHLADVAQLPNVAVRVIPSSAGAYLGLIVGSFVLLEFPRHPKIDLTMPPVVYVQGYTGDLYLEHENEIRQYRDVRTELRRRALDEAASYDLILNVAEEFSA